MNNNMYTRIFVILMLFFCLGSAFGVTVEIKSDIFSENTIFTYNFYFDEEDDYKRFSFEKPSEDAKIDYAINQDGEDLKYTTVGDYLILRPDEIRNNNFSVRFISYSVSEEVVSKKSFSIYSDFDFPVELLVHRMEMYENFGDITEIFPRDYTQTRDNVEWESENVTSDILFLVNFGSEKVSESFWSKNFRIIAILIIAVFVIIVIVFLTFFIRLKRKDRVKKKPKAEGVSKDEEKEISDKYEEVTQKYLTENEKDVADIVKENNGISQYDILNHLPSISKSNLSKIITKLNSKRILNRIRVGKINKIYLGERLEPEKEKEKEEDEKEQEESEK